MGDRLDVLVVDADAVTAEVVGVALEAIGARCEWVRDGRSALDRLNGLPADLVVLDLRLPRVGGMDVLRAMRRDPLWMTTPVIALTTCDSEDVVVGALAADADDVLSKPLHVTELRARAARRLRASGQLVATGR